MRRLRSCCERSIKVLSLGSWYKGGLRVYLKVSEGARYEENRLKTEHLLTTCSQVQLGRRNLGIFKAKTDGSPWGGRDALVSWRMGA